MALADTDLLVAYRPGNQTHYKIPASQFGANALPDGTEAGQVLVYDGAEWLPSSTIDGGVYA